MAGGIEGDGVRDDGFVVVTRKGGRKRAQRVAPVSHVLEREPPSKVTMERFMHSFPTTLDTVYCAAFVEDAWREIRSITVPLSASIRVVSLGLGNFTTTRASAGQFAALLLLKHVLCNLPGASTPSFGRSFDPDAFFRFRENVMKGIVDGGSIGNGIVIFDPAFTELERDILSRLGFDVVSVDPWGKGHVVDAVDVTLTKDESDCSKWKLWDAESREEGGCVISVIFAPHAPIELWEAVCVDAVRRQEEGKSVENVVLIGNSAEQWIRTLPPRLSSPILTPTSSGEFPAIPQAPTLARCITNTHSSTPLFPSTPSLEEKRLSEGFRSDDARTAVMRESPSRAHEELLLLAFSSSAILTFKPPK